MVTPRYFPDTGGVEMHVAQVAPRLQQAGVDVTVLTMDRSRRLPWREQVAGVEIIRVPAWPSQRDYYVAPAIFPIVAGGGWDVVHCQSYHTLVAPFAMVAALRAGIPYVVTFHGGGHSSRVRNALRGVQWWLLRPLLVRADRLVAIARFEVGLYGGVLRIPSERFVFIPNGADLGPPLPYVVPLAQDALIVSVGRLERYKGHHRLIAALPEVLRVRADARLRIVGAGPYEGELRALALALGVADRVTIGPIPPDNRAAMAELLASARLVALLSDYETHPIAALEALALGRPVLVTYGSGLAELADRGLARAIPLTSGSGDVAAAILEQLREPLVPPPLTLASWDDCAVGLRGLYEAVARRQVCAS